MKEPIDIYNETIESMRAQIDEMPELPQNHRTAFDYIIDYIQRIEESVTEIEHEKDRIRRNLGDLFNAVSRVLKHSEEE